MVSFPLKASPLQLDYSLYLQQLCTLLLRVSPRIPGTESISSEKSNWSQFCTRVREATVATAPWLYPALHCNVVWICPVIAPWNNGNRHPRGGVAEIQKMSPPTTVGDAADMQLCVIKQGSPPVLGNVAFFVTDLLTLARCAVCILNISVGVD